MAFSIDLNFITGVMLGLEFVSDEESNSRHMVLDLLIIRVLFSLYQEEE
jgi:hypothetical protein